ncbi:MAG: hypothetical protein IPP96_02425 [Chitinophagaceae bacterium]|nr:hypothetical protein [Chitinophagaceae bacterium]
MNRSITLIAIATLFSSFARSQSLSINTDGSMANSSSMLDIKSTTKGLLIPRMAKSERQAISSLQPV